MEDAGCSGWNKAADDALDAARVAAVAALASEFGPDHEWEIGDDSPLSIELDIMPAVSLSLRATAPLAPFGDIEQAKGWIESTLDLAEDAFVRLEEALAASLGHALDVDSAQ